MEHSSSKSMHPYVVLWNGSKLPNLCALAHVRFCGSCEPILLLNTLSGGLVENMHKSWLCIEVDCVAWLEIGALHYHPCKQVV